MTRPARAWVLLAALAALALARTPTWAAGDAEAPRLHDVLQVTGNLGYRSATFSLKGDELAFVRARAGGGLYRMSLENPVPVLALPGVGPEEPWRFGAEGLALEAAPRTWGERWWLSVDPSGATAMKRGEDQPIWRGVRIRDHQLEVFTRGAFTRWDLPRDHWRDPSVSDDARWIAVVGAEAGLVVVDTWGGALRYLGPAGRGSFSPGGNWLVFDRVPDGSAPAGAGNASEPLGEAADLVAYDVAADRATTLTSTPARAERRPEIAPDGKRLVFDADGAIFLGSLDLPRRGSEPRPSEVTIPRVPVPKPPRPPVPPRAPVPRRAPDGVRAP